MKEKVPFYNIVNMFFVGAVCSIGTAFIFRDLIPFKWLKDNSEILSEWNVLLTAVLLIVMYELGFIINRMSSAIIAPMLEKTKVWPKDAYHIDVSEISQANPKFQSMITELILMRSHIMIYMILMVLSLIHHRWYCVITCVGLVIMFAFAGRKHNEKINIIRNDYREKQAVAEGENPQ